MSVSFKLKNNDRYRALLTNLSAYRQGDFLQRVSAYFFDYYQGVTTYISGLYKELFEERKDISFYFASNNLTKIKSIFVSSSSRRNESV